MITFENIHNFLKNCSNVLAKLLTPTLPFFPSGANFRRRPANNWIVCNVTRKDVAICGANRRQPGPARPRWTRSGNNSHRQRDLPRYRWPPGPSRPSRTSGLSCRFLWTSSSWRLNHGRTAVYGKLAWGVAGWNL